MDAKFVSWMAKYDELQRIIDREEWAAAQELLANLEQESHALASEGLDYHDEARCLLMLVRAALLRAERRFDECRRLLSSIRPLVPMDPIMSGFIEGNVALHQGNLALHQQDPAGAISHYDQAVKHAATAMNPVLHANALFNLGTCYRLTRQDEKAMEAFEKAAEIYLHLELPSKVADTYHQIGNVLKHKGRRREAGGFQMRAADIYLQEKNHARMWMIGDDLSRVLRDVAIETRGQPESERWLRLAITYSIMASYSAEQVWQAARGTQSEGRLADLSEQFLNHAMTQCELALAHGELDLFLGTLARSKGRIREVLIPSIGSIFPDWPSDLVGMFESGVPRAATAAVGRALHELVAEDEVVAVVDQFSVQHSTLLSGVYLCRGGMSDLEWFESEPVEDPDEELDQHRSVRGNDRCIEAWGLAQRHLNSLVDHAEQCGAILGDNEQLTPEERARLDELAAEFSADGRALGKWFFPDELLSFLKQNKVSHVVLIADPAFPAVPYASLETSQGYVIDQPWSLSIATSALELVRWVARKRTLNGYRQVNWFGPDRYVNNSLGGSKELQALQKYFPINAYSTKEATREQMVRTIAAGQWVHFRGHGEWRGDVKNCGPVLHDGVLSREYLEPINGLPAFVVTTACLTGFSETVGSEVFGSLVDYERANCIGAILTSWPIHGPFATRFMGEFYAALARGENVAVAIKVASLQCRAWAVHPYFWAPFMVYGFWKVSFSLDT